MAEIQMPALVGNDALGFLAALGVLRLTASALGWDSTLCWPGGPRAGAQLGGAPNGSSCDSVAGELANLVAATREAGRLIPGIDGFPPAKKGSKGGDPVKELALRERSGLGVTSLDRPSTFGDWVIATLALGVRDGMEARDRLTAAFCAPHRSGHP